MNDSGIDSTLCDVGLSRLELLVLEQSRWYYRDSGKLADVVSTRLYLDGGTMCGINVGRVTYEQVEAAFKRIEARGLITRITEKTATQMVDERLAGQGKADITVDKLVGLLLFTEMGMEIWDRLRGTAGSGWIEQDAQRWIFRGCGAFSLACNCTAIRECPQSLVCSRLGCRVENIGPWTIPGDIVMPSGWRLTCYRKEMDAGE